MKQQLALMWDCTGLEAIMDVTARHKDACWRALRGDTPDPAPGRELSMWKLRAQYNPQRRYEIYIVDIQDLTEQDIREAFEQNPQSMADAVRARGHCVWREPTMNQREVIK